MWLKFCYLREFILGIYKYKLNFIDSEIVAANQEPKSAEDSASAGFIPNFKRHPEFHYADNTLYSSSSSSPPPPAPPLAPPQQSQTNHNQSLPHTKNNNTDLIIHQNNISSHNNIRNGASELITIKLRTNLDPDFVEMDLIPSEVASFERFREACMREFTHVHINTERVFLHRIRKLPDVLVRNLGDLRRLKSNDALEFCFRDKIESNLI